MSPFLDIFEDDFINAGIDDELTRYGKTSGNDSNDIYTKIVIHVYIYIQIHKPKRSKMYCTTQINSV